MFTSRAEYRLSLREDNADARLTPIGRELGLVDEERWRAFNLKYEAVARERERLRNVVVRPEHFDGDAMAGPERPRRELRALDLLKRPDFDYARVCSLSCVGPMPDLPDEPGEFVEQVTAQISIQARYEGYLQRQANEIERHRQYAEMALPETLDYAAVRGLSTEIRQKLSVTRPATLAQASRISGMTPAAISNLLVHIKKRRLRGG
jgi:tRNA uridine 5-carboxymethylaminomethyl modification enzyme